MLFTTELSEAEFALLQGHAKTMGVATLSLVMVEALKAFSPQPAQPVQPAEQHQAEEHQG